MGKNNRQRRAARKRRSAGQRAPRPVPVPSPTGHAPRAHDLLPFAVGREGGAPPTLEERLTQASLAYRSRRRDEVSRLLAPLVEQSPPGQQRATVEVAQLLERRVAHAWELGWQPRDLHRLARHESSDAVADLVAAAIVAQRADYRDESCWATAHWMAQVDELVEVSDPSPSGAWLERLLAAPIDATAARLALLTDAVATLSFLRNLLRLPLLHPPPSQWADEPAARVDDAAGIDAGLLQKVRALLAQAESTTFEGEADAFTAKAQQLMARHRIDRALVDQAQGAHDPDPCGRRVAVDDPYADAKTYLYTQVAQANGCEAICATSMGFVTIVGLPSDIDLVETLITSLLVQATVAITAAGPQRDAAGRSRTRSFRRSFYLSFAYRIGERLRDAVATVYADLDDADRSRALPVLADRAAEVRAAVDEMFPDTIRSRGPRVSNGAGWMAGRLAADAADLSSGPAMGS